MKFDCTKIQSEEEARSSLALPGRYHVMVESADDSFTKYKTSIPVQFQILAGTVPGQEGKRHTEFFSTSVKAMERLQLFVLAAGIVKPGEGRDVNIATEAPSKQLVIELEENEYEKKDGTKGKGRRITYKGMWSVGSKDAADVPKDREMISLTAKCQAAGLVTPAAATAKTAAATVTPEIGTASAKDPWGDL